MVTPSYYPDGLSEAVIDVLIELAYREAGAAACPSAALVDGTATERRSRRMARRALSTVVRTLPVRRVVSGPDGEAA